MKEQRTLRHTPLHQQHVALGARMTDFAGWDMPLIYPTGVVAEHLATRRTAGLFDISHMGRFTIRGRGALALLQRLLTNNAAALDVGQAQYTLIPDQAGSAIDDAYLYRFVEDGYLLVVNAANRERDWEHFQAHTADISEVELADRTAELAMLSLQGPRSRDMIAAALVKGRLPEPRRNQLSRVTIAGVDVMLSRTGYTGEPLCFELILPREGAPILWNLFAGNGAVPVGLGARDTLRLEAGLPLYGHELGTDPTGRALEIFSSPLAAFAVSFSPCKGEYVGRAALARQHAAYRKILTRDYSLIADLPRITRPVAITSRGVARAGSAVTWNGSPAGWVTSGTMVPYWKIAGRGLDSHPTEQFELRPICLALLDSRITQDERVEIDVRGKRVSGVVVAHHLRTDAPPYARAIVYGAGVTETQGQKPDTPESEAPIRHAPDEPAAAGILFQKVIANHDWRQRECVNLIPSEMTASPLVRLVSVMDPAFRYAEHRRLEAFYNDEIFYYQGTEFIDEVERLLQVEMSRYLGCAEVETRVLSGQMANMAVFSAMLEYLNGGLTKSEPRRMAMVMNHHIGRGGHLSAQPMGALKDYVRIDPRTDRAAVINFPVDPENPYQIDTASTLELLEQHRPELIIFGKSMILHKEPVAEIRRFIDERGIRAVIMYDAAHVLGLMGTHFQCPFTEGADLVTGSTHKTFFGPQRGVIATRSERHEERYQLWEAIRRRTFPGSVSNHHLGTLLGLLVATYEMNFFKDAYQPAVIAHAKAFAQALAENGVDVAGDPALAFTETHQVIVRVGYGHGPELAQRLEKNNIICNYQAAPDEEGFTAAGALRFGVAEMTRFGMDAHDFSELADLIAAVVLRDTPVKDDVRRLRRRFLDLQYCFREADYPEVVAALRTRL